MKIVCYILFLCLLPLLTSGCFATASHVDTSNRHILEIFEYQLKNDPNAPKVLGGYKKHIEGGSGIQVDPSVFKLADGLVPGLGTLLVTAVGVYARKKKLEADHATQEAVIAAGEPDKEKALARLAADKEIKGYNG